MSLKKKCQVVMLPTKEKTDIRLGLEGGYLYLNNTGYIDERTAYQHIHIVAIESLVVGDKVVFNTDVWTVIQSPEHEKNSDITYLIFNNGNIIGVHKDNLMKIIATTDTSLGLPQPSPAFIEKYVKAYNADTPIVDVMVDFEKSTYDDWIKTDTPQPKYKPKVDSMDQITITRTKDSWSREEVIDLLRKFHSDVDEVSTKTCTINFDNWVKQNF